MGTPGKIPPLSNCLMHEECRFGWKLLSPTPQPSVAFNMSYTSSLWSISSSSYCSNCVHLVVSWAWWGLTIPIHKTLAFWKIIPHNPRLCQKKDSCHPFISPIFFCWWIPPLIFGARESTIYIPWVPWHWDCMRLSYRIRMYGRC